LLSFFPFNSIELSGKGTKKAQSAEQKNGIRRPGKGKGRRGKKWYGVSGMRYAVCGKGIGQKRE
jgi:hypothetical protein